MGKMVLRGVAIIVLIAMIICTLIYSMWVRGAHAEEEDMLYEPKTLIVIAKTLNGRFRPNKKSPILAEYEFLDELQPTGKWSKDHEWIEVFHPEEKTVWVNIDFVSERLDIFEAYTLSDQPIKVRTRPEVGKVKKRVKRDQLIEITQVIMGYGRCEWGWVDLGYFIEEPHDETVPREISRK